VKAFASVDSELFARSQPLVVIGVVSRMLDACVPSHFFQINRMSTGYDGIELDSFELSWI